MLKTLALIGLIVLMVFLISNTGTARAQLPPQIAAPVLSFVVDGNHSLRPLIGIAGAATVGAPLDMGFDVAQTAIPPDHDFILATTKDGRAVLLQVRGNSIAATDARSFANVQAFGGNCDQREEDTPLPRRLRTADCSASSPDGQAAIDRIVLSPSGSAAALLSSSQQRIYTFTNLSQSLTAAGTFQMGQLSPDSAFAVSDDGRAVVIAVSGGDGSSLFLLSGNQPPRLLGSVRHASAITFLHRSNSAIVADDVDNQIFSVSGSQFFAVAREQDGISKPIAVAVSNDNQRIFIGNSQTGSVTTISASGIAPESQPCKCALTGLYATNADSVFRLTDFTGGTVLLFDASGTAPRIVFVPTRTSPF